MRHPRRRRDCSAVGVVKALTGILKYKRIPANEQEAYLEQIDRNHAAMYASEDWLKDGGQFAKALKNWLAPMEERYDIAPSAATLANDPPKVVL